MGVFFYVFQRRADKEKEIRIHRLSLNAEQTQETVVKRLLGLLTILFNAAVVLQVTCAGFPLTRGSLKNPGI